MVVAMAVYDQTPGRHSCGPKGPTDWVSSPVVPCEAPDWRSLYEQQRVRADALQARVKELTWAETSARSHAGMLKWNLDRARGQLAAADKEVKESAGTRSRACSSSRKWRAWKRFSRRLVLRRRGARR